MTEKLNIKNLDHLGLIAGIVDDLNIENIVNSLIKMDEREKVSSGTIVKAIILNGLGYMSQPLYLFPEFFRDKPVEKLLGYGIKAEVMAMLMGLCLLVYNIGQRMIRQELKKRGEKIRNQVKKWIDNPTLRWIFQLFQGIHLVEIEGREMVSNLREEIRKILSYFSDNCQKYYEY